MASQVTKTNLFSESRNNVISLITTTNISDPIGVSGQFRKWIYSREPDVKAIDFGGYPFWIVRPSIVESERKNREGTGSLDGKKKIVHWDIEVEIVTSDRGYGKKDGQGLTHMDAMSDSFASTFNSMTNRTTLSNNSMKFTNVSSTDVITEPLENELTYRRSFLLNFSSRIAVSS